jgi:hypothetical protein
VLIDTPDFDTGAGGRYANRESARGAIAAADLLIYIFTNSNYNNRDNTDFIAEMLTGIGRRKCVLIYRVYPSFTEEEVVAHAMTVAGHIYGADAGKSVLGIYRADEDNRVAAGEAFMALRPAREGDPTLAAALERLDLAQLRLELHASIVADVLGKAEELAGRARRSLEDLHRYLGALKAAQALCLQEALSFFPMDRVVRRFARIWSDSDPPAVRLMRRTGSLVELPVRALLGAAGWAREKLAGGPPAPVPEDRFARKLEENLVAAATALNHYLLSPHLTLPASAPTPATGRVPADSGEPVDRLPAPGVSMAAHPAVHPAQERLRRNDFDAALERILDRREEIGRIGREMDKELRELADHFRSRMGGWAKISQTFWAALNVLPATVAVSYVLSTGDPVGGATIKVKLAGLFGVKDLYALVAIPVTRGMKKADRKNCRRCSARSPERGCRENRRPCRRSSKRPSPGISCTLRRRPPPRPAVSPNPSRGRSPAPPPRGRHENIAAADGLSEGSGSYRRLYARARALQRRSGSSFLVAARRRAQPAVRGGTGDDRPHRPAARPQSGGGGDRSLRLRQIDPGQRPRGGRGDLPGRARSTDDPEGGGPGRRRSRMRVELGRELGADALDLQAPRRRAAAGRGVPDRHAGHRQHGEPVPPADARARRGPFGCV